MFASANSDGSVGALSALALKLGQESGRLGCVNRPWVVRWSLTRNCSMSPIQVGGAFALLCALSLGIALFFWVQGVRMVAPFAMFELLAVGLALVLYARRAGDSEIITVSPGVVTVERNVAGRSGREEFLAAWVRVECAPDGRSLVTLSGQGRCVAIGRFVRPELRADLARELRLALRRSGEATSDSHLIDITSKQN